MHLIIIYRFCNGEIIHRLYTNAFLLHYLQSYYTKCVPEKLNSELLYTFTFFGGKVLRTTFIVSKVTLRG